MIGHKYMMTGVDPPFDWFRMATTGPDVLHNHIFKFFDVQGMHEDYSIHINNTIVFLQNNCSHLDNIILDLHYLENWHEDFIIN